MADPKTRYQLDGVTYEEQPDGSFTKVTPATKPDSIADGKISGFKAPKVPVSIPAREKILSEPLPMEEIATPSIPGSGILAGAQSLLTPEGRKSAAQQGISLGASMIPGGGFFANLAKSAIGATGGNIVGQALEGKPELDLGETTQEGLLDIGANLVLGAIPFVGDQAYKASKPFIRNVQKYGTKEALARALAASPVIRPEMQAGQYIDPLRERNVAPGMTTRESITAGGDVPMSVGSATGSKTMQFMESLLAPDAAQVLRQEGTKANVGKIAKLTAPGTLGERGRAGIARLEAVKKMFTDAEEKQYPAVQELANKNIRTITSPGPPEKQIIPGMYGNKVEMVPTTTVREIVGPVFLADSVTLAQKTLPGLRTAVEEIQSPTLLGELPGIIKTLEGFEKGRIIDYASARKLQANLNGILEEGKGQILSSNTRRVLRELKGKIDTDILESMQAHWKVGNPAKEYSKALSITRRKYEAIPERLQKAYYKGNQTP